MMKTKGIYLHIPFCVKRCSYCDFLTFERIGKEGIASYIDGLVRHIRDYNLDISPVDSIYFGGGSPSFVDGEHIERLMEELGKAFTILDHSEITIEANPESISKDKLKLYKDAGINRLSIGAQSMDDNLLKTLARVHDRNEFIEKYKLAREIGFDNISVDLIFALPGQSMEVWMKSLEEVIKLGPEHISFYALQIEEGTLLKELIDKGDLKAIDEETDRAMYHGAIEFMENHGYIHYEISNSAKASYMSRHNLKYWSMEDYLGLGLGAHSYIAGTRYRNEEDIESYIGGQYVAEIYENKAMDERAEFLFTGLRKVEGIPIKSFQERFGLSLEVLYKSAIEKNIEEGLLEIKRQDGNSFMKLTRKGLDLFNNVLVDFV